MAPPPATRAARPVLDPGDVLAARYRLRRPVQPATPGQDRSAVLWLATDEVLGRPVAVKVLAAPHGSADPLVQPFLEAAATAGAVVHPVLARVDDASVQQRAGRISRAAAADRGAGGSTGPGDDDVDVAYVISEWVDGTRLADVLASDGPFDAADAVALTTTVAEALTVAHERGLPHGRLHPGNVLLTRNGSVRITDLAVSAALPDGTVAAARADDPEPQAADVRDLAALLYALLTGRWPDSATPQPSGGVPPAPAGREGPNKRRRLVSPRQVRAGVPRALDAVVVRALDPVAARTPPELTTAAQLSDALEAAVRAEPSGRPAPTAPRGPRLPGLRRRLPLLAVVVLLTVLGVAGFVAGRTVGAVPTPPGQLAASPAPSSPVGPAAPLDLTGVAVRDFDPLGDGAERPGSVANAHDGDPTTAWSTERYDSPEFAGLKDGVGLLVDLRTPTALASAEVVLEEPGVTVELRGAATASDDPADYRVLASGQADGERLRLVPSAGTSDRYYLVWITRLPPAEGRTSAGIAELLFTGGAA